MRPISLLACLASALSIAAAPLAAAADAPWYGEGDFAPKTRIEFTIENPLDIARPDCPITIPRAQLPVQNIHEMELSVVDPGAEGRPAPSKELLARQGGHQMLAETNGRQLDRQLDDLDKDGVWDELFFQVDLAPRETRTMYLYLGFSQRGWNPHGTHAAIGSYCRHLMPFWESKNIGWKLWYPTDVDMYGKRGPMLVSQHLYMENLDGYGLPREMGSDIQNVATSFGAGGIGLYEDPASPDVISRPRFTAAAATNEAHGGWNIGWADDTRYAFEVVANGPMRSMIRARTMNWNTPRGEYELEQLYTAYTNQSYSSCRVRFTRFLPREEGVAFACGIRKNARQYDSIQQGGTVITIGDDEIVDPDYAGETTSTTKVEFVGNALIVADRYQPQYQFIESGEGNHTFRVPVTADLSFEYLIAGAWSEGEVYNNADAFKDYVARTAQGHNHPPVITVRPELQNKE